MASSAQPRVLGHLRLYQVAEGHLEGLYEAMQTIHDPPEHPSELLRRLIAARATVTWTREGKTEPGLWLRRPISPARIHRIHAVIRSALGSAVKRGILARNPAMTVRRMVRQWSGRRSLKLLNEHSAPRSIKGRAGGKWSRLGESNPGPTHYECVALTD